MNSNILGRKQELSLLKDIYHSQKAEFLAVYGRRRVGKTYLIREFSNPQKGLFFQISGIKDAAAKVQLKELGVEIKRVFYSSLKATKIETPKNWFAAFEMLNEAISFVDKTKKIIIFFDEFPWLAIKKDKLLQALDYYWNRYWSTQKNIKLIICGSAAFWIIKNILNNKGGLHNRVTRRLLIEPFKLQEVKDYLKYQGINYDNYQVLQLYMCIGGIPYYLEMLKKGLSATQNVNQLCFQKKGSLQDEFKNLFTALFDKGTNHEAIIRLIAAKREGLGREAIERSLQLKGGTLTLWLKELEEAGFITSFIPWNRKYGTYYKIIDEYVYFYLTWIEPMSKSRLNLDAKTKWWENMSQTSAWKSWAGLAFEAVCYKHIDNIRTALNIPEGAVASTWRYIPLKRSKLSGAQIDLLFDHPDNMINICEIKYANSSYKIDKEDANILENKRKVYQEATKTKKQIVLSMITTHGLKNSDYAKDLIFSSCTLEGLFD